MNPADLAREVERFDRALPIDQASTPPASWYVEPAFLALEEERVFRRNWTCAARADQVLAPGDYATGHLLNQHPLVLRDEDDGLRAFHNVCRHHAARILDGAGKCAELTCPYHGWSYGLDGALRRAPRSGGIADFDRADFGLVPMGVEQWGPLVAVHHDPAAAPWAQELGDLATRLNLDGLRFVARREYRLRCNWKVFVDNYLDGGYHVRVAHPGLAHQLDLGSYRAELFGRYSVQSCAGADAEPERGDFSERLGDRALYVWVYPNLMLNRYGPILDTNLVVPLAVDETAVVFDYWFDEAHADDEEFVARSLEASDRVQAEDVGLCESVQEGLASPAYDVGRYAPKVETPEHHFHRLLAEDLAREA